MPRHCATMKKITRVSLKENLTRKTPLKHSLCCDKKNVFSFLSSLRSKNNDFLVWWGISHVAAAHDNGATKKSQKK